MIIKKLIRQKDVQSEVNLPNTGERIFEIWYFSYRTFFG
jgi:hypothetical protein